MFRVQVILVLISITLSVAEDFLDYASLGLEPRPLPPELSFITSANKTHHELIIEECMKDYGACIAAEKVLKFCGINEKRQNRTFYTLCEMTYENCKLGTRTWEFIKDGECEKIL